MLVIAMVGAVSDHDQLGVDDFDRPPLSAYQTRSGIKMNGATHDGRPASQPQPFGVRRLDEMSSEPHAAVIQGINWDAGSVCAIVGVPNGGKTALGIDAALSIATKAERWLGLKVAGGPTLYVAAEAPGSVLTRAHGARRRKFSGNRVAFYFTSAAPALGGEDTSTLDAERLVNTIRQVESEEGEAVKVLFIDTLASCLGSGDENGDGMLRLVNAAKFVAAKTGVCVVLIHHPSKGDSSGLRGHGSLPAACDSILRIEVEDLTGVRVATLVKARDYATGLQLRFELEQVVLDVHDSFGDQRSTVVVKSASTPAPRRRPRGSARERLFSELERRHKAGETKWSRADVYKAARDLSPPMHRNSAAKALDALIVGGFLKGTDASMELKETPD
jgi:KaiC/GvpD/RAD55 family RecA-like ATPase